MPAPDVKPVWPLDGALDAMAKAVRSLHASQNTGALANLRRLDPDRPLAPDFHALLAQTVPDHLFAGGEDLDAMTSRFARVAQNMAMKPDGLGGKRLGEVLHAVGFPQTRLAMLLNAQGSTLDDLVRRVARRIAASEEPLPYRDLARLILDERRDELRLRIARDYQRAARASSKTAKDDATKSP